MWMINCILLIVGTVASVCGISFYFRNKEASGYIRFYICSYGLSAGVWCFFFALIGFSNDLELCYSLRKAGLVGVVGFLVTETFLVTDISGARKSVAKAFKIFAVVAGIVDYFVFSQNAVDIFVRKNGWTTWVANSDGSFNRHVHSFYVVITFLILFSFGIVWMKKNTVKRLRRFLYIVFAANFTLLFFTLPDTFLPAMGKEAVSTSGIGAALCAIVMWYGATQLGSFDIRTGNIKDRIFDFLEAGVIVLDVNKKAAIMNRYSRNLEEPNGRIGSGIDEFFDLSKEQADEMFKTSMEDIYVGRLWNRAKTKAYSVRMSAVRDNLEEVYCFLCVFVDVTEEVEAVTKFEIASRAKSRFLAQMSHEIRTPINAVLGMNEMIIRESKEKDIIGYAESIDSAGNTLLSLINSILDFSKIEDGKMDVVTVQYDTASLINDMYHSIIQRADTKGLLFRLDVDETLPCTLRGDDVKVSQVIMNLLTNAVKYTEKGSVTLSMRVHEKIDGKVKIAVSVKDTGIGIREADREKLFESFERLDEIRNHNIEGTGLGITIVKSLLEMMGSRLKVESKYGEGSDFSFIIEQEIYDATPIGNFEERLKKSTVHKDKEELINAPNAKVLIVDDNDMNLKVAKNLLKLCGIKPDEAPSGEETIRLMREKNYDIVFLDHMMPVMDGIETLHKLLDEHLVPESTTIIALTANAVVGARESYIAEGFADYLSKPIEIKHLVEKLKKYLPQSAYEKKAVEEAGKSAAGVGNTAVEETGRSAAEAGKTAAEESGNVAAGEAAVDFAEEFIEEFAPEGEVSTGFDKGKLAAAGISVETGLHYCTDDELYFDMLTDYVTLGREKVEELKKFYAEQNWKDYKVKVHALKSNSEMVGAMNIHKMAKALEEAAKNEDISYIEAHHSELISAYDKTAADIENCR